MMAAEALYAKPEVEITWSRTVLLLRRYYAHGRRLDGFAGANWRDELGVRVQGTPPDPMALVAEILSADGAVSALRDRCNPAYKLLIHDIFRRCRSRRKDPKHVCDRLCERWFNSWGTGPAQMMGIDRETAHRLYEAGKIYVWWLLEGEGDEPAELKEAFA